MGSLTNDMIGYLAPDLQGETQPLRGQLPVRVQELLTRPPTGLKFRDVRDLVSGADESERGAMISPEELDLQVLGHPDADWFAVGIPVLTWDEMDSFVEGWRELADDEAFLSELHDVQYWEGQQTIDGRWAIVPQDRSETLSVALPVLVGYGDRIVFERATLLEFRVDTWHSVRTAERSTNCALESTKQLPNVPYRGSCEHRGCATGCEPILGRASDGTRILLACNC
jgi:hypothetical protein